jgi:hypothetical protein
VLGGLWGERTGSRRAAFRGDGASVSGERVSRVPLETYVEAVILPELAPTVSDDAVVERMFEVQQAGALTRIAADAAPAQVLQHFFPGTSMR